MSYKCVSFCFTKTTNGTNSLTDVELAPSVCWGVLDGFGVGVMNEMMNVVSQHYSIIHEARLSWMK